MADKGSMEYKKMKPSYFWLNCLQFYILVNGNIFSFDYENLLNSRNSFFSYHLDVSIEHLQSKNNQVEFISMYVLKKRQ